MITKEKFPDFSKEIRDRAESIKYENLWWKRARTGRDYLAAYVQTITQTGFSFSSDLMYAGLLNDTEKKEFKKGREEAKKAYEERRTTPLQALQNEMAQWIEYSTSPQMFVSGDIFLSKVLKNKSKHYASDGKKGRISFSANLSKLDGFFNYMMEELSEGSLSEVPVKFKIEDSLPYQQGNGESAHLYFNSSDEFHVYRVIVDSIHPVLEKNNYNSLGGRFLMIPVRDYYKNALKGIEFGQGILRRSDIHTQKREEILNKNHGEVATSGVISDFAGKVQKELSPEMAEKFKKTYKERGRFSLISDNDFAKVDQKLNIYLAELGRMPSYPVLDRDAKKMFPHFIQTVCEAII